MTGYKKFFAEIVATAGVAIAAAITDNIITSVEGVNILIVLFAVVGVLGAGNLPAGVWKYAKSIVAAGGAATVLLATLMGTGGFENVSYAEWIQIALAAAGALGVYGFSGPVVVESARVQHLG